MAGSSGSQRRRRPSRRRERSACDSNPGRGGWGRRPATANPSRRRRHSAAVRTGCLTVAWREGLGSSSAALPAPPSPRVRLGEGTEGSARRRGEEYDRRTENSLTPRGRMGRAYVRASAPTWGGGDPVYRHVMWPPVPAPPTQRPQIVALKSHGCDTSWFFLSPVLDSNVMYNGVCVCVCVCVLWCGTGRFSPGVGWLAYSRINPYERRATVDSVFLARYERDSVSTGSSESIKREWS